MTHPSPAEKPFDFNALRHNPNHHLGLGDIRLTVAQQDEIEWQLSRLAGELARVEDAKEEAVRAAFRDGPITADGVKITEGMSVYWWCAAQRVERGIWPASLPFAMPHRCYSTREAAQAARTEVGRG